MVSTVLRFAYVWALPQNFPVTLIKGTSPYFWSTEGDPFLSRFLLSSSPSFFPSDSKCSLRMGGNWGCLTSKKNQGNGGRAFGIRKKK